MDPPVIGKDEAGQSSETGQNLGATQSIPAEEQPKSSPGIGKSETGQSSEGTQSIPEKEQRKSNSGDAKEIWEKLSNCNEEAVVLTGDAGTGKTWLAREITKSAVSAKAEGPFYMSLWISLKKEHQDDLSLHQSIALQLSIPTSAGLWEDADDIDDWKEVYLATGSMEKLELKTREKLKLDSKITEKLTEKLREMDMKNSEQQYTFLLLVLDSEGVVKHGDYVDIKNKLDHWKDQTESNLKEKFTIKYLITTRNTEECPSLEQNIVFEIQPHSGDEAVNFIKEKVGKNFSHPKFDTFCNKVKVRSKVLPAQIIMLAGALNHIAKDDSEAHRSEALERAFDAALNILEHASNDDPIPLLHFTYEKLPDDCMIDCFWHSWNVLGKHGGVQYNELITHWILEGHLDLAAGVKTAYDKGYQVMMELIDRGMLKMQEDNLIVLEEATLTLDDQSCRGLFETSNLGLANMLDGDNRKVFERMAPAEGMMKTASMDKKGEPVCSLLIDGSRLCREVPDTFFQAKQDLKVLALFYPRLTMLPQSISEMKHLLVLVLRGCYLLNDILRIMDLKALIVLEISGSPFLKEMPDEFFADMSQLRSLNLSALGIKSLPSFSNLTELRRLILRKCSFLEDLPRLANLKKLEVIDLSGSSSLKKIQEKSFKSFEKLRVIDFSETKIEKLPIVQTLKHLSLLLVRGCDCLYGLRMMKHLPSLKVLDVSGAIRIKEIYYDCFEDTDNLRILDLSKTKIRFLPDSLGKHLCDLRLKDCPKLEKLPSTTALTDLVSLDLSDSSGLQEFPDEFFKNLTSLQSLNLSNTEVKSLPSPFNLPNLRHLLLKGCSFESLPELKECTGLVELDLSNCKSSAGQFPSLANLKYLEIINLSSYKPLSEIDTSFAHMSWLQVLNLSETKISSLPSLCNPSKLRSLILRNCKELKSSPDFKILSQLEQLDLRGTTFDVMADSLNPLTQIQTLQLSKIAVEGIKSSLLENLKKLEVLDLSGEDVESLPSLDGLSNLRKLLLRGCSSLEKLPSLNSLSHLEVLDLSGTKVNNLGEKISELTHLKCLHLPKEGTEEFKNGKNAKFLPLELKLDRCCISKSSDIPERGAKITVHGTELFKSLKEDLKKDSALLKRIKHSSFSVHSQSKDEDNYGNSRKNIFSGIYSNMRNLPEAEDGPLLEIHGFDDFPTDIEVVLDHAKYIFLVENNFLKNLSDLKNGSLENIKGFWLERCTRMESIFMGANLGKWENLEILWISNLPKLKSLYDEKVQSLSFRNLKKLYIDCCPMLETVFSSGKIPENLETLKIIFCDKLKTLVGDKGLANREVQTTGSTNKEGQTIISANKKVESTSPVDMEEQITSSADKKVEAETMSSADKEVEAETMSSADKEAEAQTMSSADKEVEAQTTSSADKELQAQTTSFASKELQMQTTSSADKEVQTQTTSSADKEVQTTSGTNLTYLQISYCPMLETLFSSAELPTILDLPNLRTLHMLELPNWTSSSIRLKLNKSFLKNVKVGPNIRVEESQQVGHA
ncbi:hypothetical protein CRYUN_Cryun13aG0153200 [Craigia yunnanensis]